MVPTLDDCFNYVRQDHVLQCDVEDDLMRKRGKLVMIGGPAQHRKPELPRLIA